MQTITTTTTKDGVHLLFYKIHLCICLGHRQLGSSSRYTQPVLIPFFSSYLKAFLFPLRKPFSYLWMYRQIQFNILSIRNIYDSFLPAGSMVKDAPSTCCFIYNMTLKELLFGQTCNKIYCQQRRILYIYLVPYYQE